MIRRIKNSKSIRQEVYEILRDYIAGTEISPGNKIDEESLSRKLGVSKTPIREALSKLAHDGIVEIKPNRGAYKVVLSKEDVSEIMMIREALEGLCIRLATVHVNDKIMKRLKGLLDDMESKYSKNDFSGFLNGHYEFHALIHTAARSPRLMRMIQSMYDLINLVRVQYFSNPQNVRRSLAFHRELLGAMKKRDADLAEKIRKDMLRSAYQSLLELA